MGYLRDMYGTQSDDFVKGFLAAMEAYGIWKDGKRHIGTMEHDLADEMREVVKELAAVPEDFEKLIKRMTT